MMAAMSLVMRSARKLAMSSAEKNLQMKVAR
ncbi:hypothetical protein BH11PSE11_BH11PSE11_00480 [soil metagenome]